jgi:pyruvate kinase
MTQIFKARDNTDHRQTKIVATLGPASNTKETIAALHQAGANVFRLNFSHGSHDDMANLVKIIREIEAEAKQPIAILADLQGPKLRIGRFENGHIDINTDDIIRFDSNPADGNNTRVHLPHPEVLGTLKTDDHIFLDDGKVRIEITQTGSDDHGAYLDGRVIAGSKLSNNKGFNLPGVMVPIPALTEKDRADLPVALGLNVDWIAQSFVQKPDDVRDARAMIDAYNKDAEKNKTAPCHAGLMIKLEKPSALECLDELVELCDAVMLARGDLGVEIPPEHVPSVQKRVIRYVHEAGKPIIVATQMLESMIDNARPTRAEASDVATAVYDGADAVMLSAETAAGDYPVKSVEIMSRIAHYTEHDETYESMMNTTRHNLDWDETGDPSSAITSAAFYVAQDIEASAIVTYTMSGSTALRTAKMRPEMPIICLTPDEAVARRLVLSYGVQPIHTPEQMDDFTGPARHAAKVLRDTGFAQDGDSFVMTAGVPFGTPGSTNILRIAKV